MKLKFIAISLVLLCCFMGAASAAEDISADAAAIDDVAVTDDSISVELADAGSDIGQFDASIEANDKEGNTRASDTQTVSNWSDLETYAETPGTDYTINLNGQINITTGDIQFKNNAIIKGNANSYITGNADGRIPFQCEDLALDITFEDVTFRDISSTMLIQMQNSGVTNLIGCTFTNVNASMDGKNSTVYNNNGIMNIINCTFENCNGAYGPITNHKAGTTTGVTLNVYNSTFENNHGNAPGVINNCGIMNLYTSVFNNNSANQWGGAIHTHSSATSTIRNCSFNGNVAGWNGGALYGYGTIKVYDSNFTNNNCSTNNGGGAIGASNYFFTKYTVIVNNCRFVDNNNLCYLFDENSTETLGRGGAISVLNGGTLNVLNSNFIHNGAKIGQAICGYNTNYYSNISSGEFVLKVVNNEFINHTITDNDTVYYEGGCTFSGNTFINSTQTLLGTNNVILSLKPNLRVSKMDILGMSENNVLSANPIDLYVNASSNKIFFDEYMWEINQDANALSWETAPSSGTELGQMDLFMEIVGKYSDEGYDIFNINIADGVYEWIPSMAYDVNYIGFGNNVIFKFNDLSYGSMLSNHKVTFTNIIFLDSTITFDDFEFGFTNCTFRNCTIEFAKVKSSKTYSEDTNVKICPATLTDCRFVDSVADYIINAHKYELVSIDNCTFDNVAADAIILVTSNYTDSLDANDGVTIDKINLINSAVKGIIKVEKDSLSRLSSGNINHDFATVQDELVDGDYTYKVVPVNATTLTVNVADIKEGEDFTIDVTLSDNLTAIVSVVIDGKEYNVSVSEGVGSLNVSDKLAANTYDVAASYAGEYPYAASNASSTFKVEKVIVPDNGTNGSSSGNGTTPGDAGSGGSGTVAPATGSSSSKTKVASKIVAAKKTFKAKVKVKKYTITLKAGKKAIKKAKVTLKIGKKTYKATTNAKGKAVFKIKKLTKKGKYKATIKFAGNKNYKASTKKVKITIK